MDNSTYTLAQSKVVQWNAFAALLNAGGLGAGIVLIGYGVYEWGLAAVVASIGFYMICRGLVWKWERKALLASEGSGPGDSQTLGLLEGNYEMECADIVVRKKD